MENNTIVVEKKNFVQKIGTGISKLGDKIENFEKKHEVGIKRAKAAATVIGGAAVLGLVIGGKRKSKVEAIDCEYEEVPTTEEALQQLEEMETEVEESEKEETEEE